MIRRDCAGVAAFLLMHCIGMAAAAGGVNPAAPKPEMPRILKTNRAAVANFKHWIALQHIGVSDKPVSEFIIAFSPGASNGELKYAQLAKIIVLSDTDYAPILDFIHGSENAGSTASADRGSFQISVFSMLDMNEVFYMAPLQSEAFFSFLSAHLQKNKNIKADVKKTAADMKEFLSRIKAKK
ncbi:MAG: hypothetical protein HYV14_01650 [Elusimicrobia bacterium]|nr:hypothetical protein [Elusimicrobiota bacterium]